MTGSKDLKAIEQELLLALATEQERYEARHGWSFRHTLWSRVSYTLAEARGRLKPTHIPGKFDMDRAFERTFRRLVERLIRRGLVRFRPIGDRRQPRQTLGYRGHEARVRDIFLTDAGKIAAAELRASAPAPTDGPPAAIVPEPDGDLGGRPAPPIPEPDGDPGWPAAAPPTPVLELAPATLEVDAPTPTAPSPVAATRRPRVVPRPRAERTPRRAPEVRPRAPRRSR